MRKFALAAALLNLVLWRLVLRPVELVAPAQADAPPSLLSPQATVAALPADNELGGTRLVQYCSQFAPIPIPDNNNDPATGLITITDEAEILDANVIISVTHPWVGDLSMNLSAFHQGSGVSYYVLNRPGYPLLPLGCSGNDYDGLIVDDEGLHGTVEDQCGDNPVNVVGNRYRGGDPPAPVMQLLDERQTVGEWTLRVWDHSPFQTGRLQDFCLEFIIPDHSPTPTPPPGGQHITYCSSFAPIPIPDGGLPVTGTLTIPDARTILDMNVVLTAAHNSVGDLSFILSNGTTPLTLVDRPGVPESQFGCRANDYDGLVLDDEGENGAVETLCNPTVPTNGVGSRYIVGDPPDPSALTVFDGAPANGQWTLTASDAIVDGQSNGVLEEFCLDILLQSSTATPVASVTPSATSPSGTRTPTATGTPPTPTRTPSGTPLAGTPTVTPPPGDLLLYLPMIRRAP